MNIRKISLAILTVAVAAPVIASASPEDAALNACAKAYASSLSGGSIAPAYQLNYSGQDRSLGSVVRFFEHSYSFTLNAQDRKTGAALTSMTCRADAHGEVLALTPVSSTPNTKLASR